MSLAASSLNKVGFVLRQPCVDPTHRHVVGGAITGL